MSLLDTVQVQEMQVTEIDNKTTLDKADSDNEESAFQPVKIEIEEQVTLSRKVIYGKMIILEHIGKMLPNLL